MGKLRKELTRKFGEEKVAFLEHEAECLELFTKEEIRLIKQSVVNEVTASAYVTSADKDVLMGALEKMDD